MRIIDAVIQVLLFAEVREAAGVERLTVSEAGTPAELFEELVGRYPGLKRFRSRLLVAVNQAFANWDQPLQPGDEVAFLPPVSGGAHK